MKTTARKKVPSKLTKSLVVRLVKDALEPHQPIDYQIRIVDDKDAVEKRHGIWFVVVEPTREDVKSYDFVARLAEAGADLTEQNDAMIQLTTVFRDESD